MAVIYTDVRGGTVLRDKQVKRAARRLWQVPLNMGVSVGISRRGAAAAMARTRGGGDLRPKRDRRRRTGLEGMGLGGNLHFRRFDTGISILQPLIGRLVECCSVLASVSL